MRYAAHCTWIQDKNIFKVHSSQNSYYNFSSFFFFFLTFKYFKSENRAFLVLPRKIHLWKCDCVCAEVEVGWVFLTLLHAVSEINLQGPKGRPCDLPLGKSHELFCLAPESQCLSLLLCFSHSIHKGAGSHWTPLGRELMPLSEF